MAICSRDIYKPNKHKCILIMMMNDDGWDELWSSRYLHICLSTYLLPADVTSFSIVKWFVFFIFFRWANIWFSDSYHNYHTIWQRIRKTKMPVPLHTCHREQMGSQLICAICGIAVSNVFLASSAFFFMHASTPSTVVCKKVSLTFDISAIRYSLTYNVNKKNSVRVGIWLNVKVWLWQHVGFSSL